MALTLTICKELGYTCFDVLLGTGARVTCFSRDSYFRSNIRFLAATTRTNEHNVSSVSRRHRSETSSQFQQFVRGAKIKGHALRGCCPNWIVTQRDHKVRKDGLFEQKGSKASKVYGSRMLFRR